ncbi:MAG: MFS transporter [Candidatus Coatesbacteria bacterium]|nr:MFS transporter [Candidatus Coatesbacteria bacterium]
MADTTDKRRGWLSWPVAFWALYDLANTIFSMAVITLFLPQWITDDLGLTDLTYAVPLAVSMLLVGLTTPYLGARADERGDHLRPLRVLTLVSVGATAAMGLTAMSGGPLWLRAGGTLLLFVAANYGFQAAQVFYNSLLPSLAEPKKRGKVSGLGVALGYLGSIIAFVVIFPVTQGSVVAGYAGRAASFIPTALLFGVLAIPCLIGVREKRRRKPPPGEGVFRRYLKVLRETGDYPGLRRYLLAAFLFLEAVHTIISFMAVYMQKVLGMPDEVKVPIFLVGTLASIAGGFTWGWLSDRLGPRRTLTIILTAWLGPVLLGVFSHTPWVFYVVAGLVGFLLAGIWTTTRPMLLTLIPAAKAGEFFGLLALAGKAAAVVGPLLWGVVADVFREIEPWNYRLALLTMGLMLGAGLLLFLGVRQQRPEA